MSDTGERGSDPLVDEVRRTRQRLIAEHGGLHGWVEHLKEQQERHPEKLVSRCDTARER